MKENIIETVKTSEVTSQELNSAVSIAMAEAKSKEIQVTQNTTTVQLPSNGLINPNIKEVTLRRLSVKESKTLLTSNDPNYLTTLLVGCIIDPVNISTKDLHPNDIIYLLFVLRYISSPKSIEQRAICSNQRCQHQFNVKVDVPSLKVNYAKPESYKFSVTLPDSGDTLTFKILSEFDITNCEKIATRQIRQENIQDSQWHILISKEAYMIQLKNNEEFKSFDEKVKYLESLSMYDFDVFNKAYNDITSSFGLDRKFITECPSCHNDVEVEAYIAPDFFRLV